MKAGNSHSREQIKKFSLIWRIQENDFIDKFWKIFYSKKNLSKSHALYIYKGEKLEIIQALRPILELGIFQSPTKAHEWSEFPYLSSWLAPRFGKFRVIFLHISFIFLPISLYFFTSPSYPFIFLQHLGPKGGAREEGAKISYSPQR